MTLGGALTEGYVVCDRFQLLRLLGRGGMGSVWVARHLSLHVDVAIKFIDGAGAVREEARSRFAQEARTAARIQSPHVVHILDYGFDGDRPFIAMELLQGEPLSVRLARERRMSPEAAASVVGQAAKGLMRAHALGIVHRDLKPDNLFLCRDDEDPAGVQVKILDFGIARDESRLAGAVHRTGTGQLLGTPAYMSPEQALGRPTIDFRSDLYSLAVVAYHCVTGRLPFFSEAVGEMIVALTTQEPPPPSSVVRGLPPAVDAWFHRAFQKDPAARFGTAKEMADAFLVAAKSAGSAFERTVLAAHGVPVTPPYASVPPGPAPTRLSAGVVRAGSIAPPMPAGATATPHPVAQPMTPHASSFPPAARVSAPRVSSAPPRAPDTFNGQYATQGQPGIAAPSRSAAPLVVALLALVVFVALGGLGVYAVSGRLATTGTAPPPSPTTTTADAAPAEPPVVTLSPPVEPPPSSSAPTPPPAASSSASPLPAHHSHPTHATSASPPPTPPPHPTTNDYGL